MEIIDHKIKPWLFVNIVDSIYDDGSIVRGNCLRIKSPFGAKLHWLQMWIISFGFRRFPKFTGGKGYIHTPSI